MAIYEVVDPGGAATRELLTALADVRRGRIVCDVLPHTRRLEPLADAMLAGLGRSANLAGVARNQHRKWDRVRAWVHAEGITDIFVFPIDEIHGSLHKWLLTLAVDHDVDLWLIGEVASPTSSSGVSPRRMRSTDAALRARRNIPVRPIDLTRFTNRWRQEVDIHRPLETSVAWPVPPEHGFLRFLYQAHIELDPDAFHRVRSAWRRGYQLTCGRLAEGGDINEDAHALFIRKLCASSSSYREMLCVLRGSQAAYFVEGDALLRINPSRLSAHIPNASVTDLDDGAAVERLRGFICPARAAASAIRLIAGAGPSEIASMTVADVAADGSSIAIAGVSHAVPVEARALVRGQRYIRNAIHKAHDDEPLLVYDAPGRAQATTRVVAGWLRDATLKADVPLVSKRLSHKSPSHRTWVFRRGFSLSRLRTT